jgi:hypothetical protein
MAEKRMFAKTIIDSDAFLDMPLSSQALYFHLSMRADDEGFVNNPKKVQRMIGASDDDLKILIGKSFLIPFESGIVVIKHWRIHNYIRQDRKHETKYCEEKALLEVKENGAYTLSSELCQSDVSQMSDKCHTEVRLGKDRLDIKNTNSILCSSSEEPKEERATIKKADIDKVLSEWNSIDGIPKVTKLATGTKRYKMLKQRIEEYSLNDVLKAIENVRNSDFLTNKWKGFNFEWFVKPNNFPKVLEGNYNKESGNERTSRQSDEDSEYKWEDYYPDIPLS